MMNSVGCRVKQKYVCFLLSALLMTEIMTDECAEHKEQKY